MFGQIQCMAVRKTEIFIGFRNKSNKITVYDVIDLNEIKSIILQGIQDGYFPCDMTAIADRIFVCVSDGKGGNNYKSLIFEEKNGRILSELTKPTDTVQWYVSSVGVNVNTLGTAAVVWYDSYYYKEGEDNTVVFYSLLSENNCSFLIVEVESGVIRIRISDRGDRTITGNLWTGEVKVYDMADFFTYHHLRENLIAQLQREECVRLIKYFALPPHQADAILKSRTPKGNLFLALEERGIIQPSSVDRLIEAFHELNFTSSWIYLVNLYRQTRRVTSYDRFLATLSAHLTVSLPEDLCGYFKISDEKKSSITLSENPGLSLLMALDEMGIIKPSEVEALEQPLTELKLVQAVAKIHEYQSIVAEKSQLLEGADPAMEAKKRIFIQCLQKKIKSWYETMTPVPWKKSCRWKSAELFVGSGLVLTDSKAKRSLMEIDEKCKLKYTEIFCHESLKEEARIVLEGDPGSGKTMLASQLAYDWSLGKITEINILIFLPLKIVEGKSLVESLREFYVPENKGLSASDIEGLLTDEGKKCCFILDGLEEYNGGEEPSEVMQVMTKAKYSSCKVILTSRSEYAQNLPSCPMLKLGRFGEAERNAYIEKVFSENHEKQLEVKQVIEDNPFILDLCNIPVLFVLAVHNIESMEGMKERSLDRVSPFMASMVGTLCSSVISKDTAVKRKYQKHGDASLEEIAFNGLCKGYQQLSWPKEDIETSVPNSKQWLDSGILVVDDTNVSLDEEKNEHQILSSGKGEASGSTDLQRGEPATLSELAESSISRRKVADVVRSPQSEVPDIVSSPPTKKKPGVCRRFVKRIRISTADASFPSSSGQQSPSHSVSKVRDKAEEARIKAKHVTLQVKFLHKLMQEWFAAKHFASEYTKLVSHNVREAWLRKNLSSINPTDLHYVLRFSCNLYAPCTHPIMKHLLTSYHSEEGSIPEHIINCAFLCFAEFEGDPGSEILEAITMICNENITINSEDSRLLQHAKASMLKLASDSRIMIKKIILADLVISSKKDFLTFNSGVTMDVIDTLQEMEMRRWDYILKEEDYPDIFKYIAKCSFLEEVKLYFPAQPPKLDKETLIELEIDHKRVTWTISPRVCQTLDTTTGKWQHGSGFHENLDENVDVRTDLHKQQFVDEQGGTLFLYEADVSLHVPAGALSNGCVLHVIVPIDPRICCPDHGVIPRITPLIICEPDNLHFHVPVKLTLPHCAVLQNPRNHTVEVKFGHKANESSREMIWRSETVEYSLSEHYCCVFLNHFSGVDIIVGSVEEKMLRVIPYTKLGQSGKHVLNVWICNDLESDFQICDLKMPVKFIKPFHWTEQMRHLYSTDTKASARPYTAVVYMDPIKHFNDDVITTLWLWPFDSTTEIFKCLQEEQELQYRHQVDSENSFAIVDEKLDIVTKTQFRNGRWLLSPEEMKIETGRIRFGSRAKFQFIGKRDRSNESEYIELQVDTFQVQEQTITFMADVELNKLLYEKRQKEIGEIEKLKACVNEDDSKSSCEDSNYKSLQSQTNVLPSTSSTASNNKPSQSKHDVEGNIHPRGPELNTKTKEELLQDCVMWLSQKLGDSWKFVGRNLKLSDTVLAEIEKNHTGMREHSYQMLVKWKNKSGSDLSYTELIQALLKVDRRDLADEVKKLDRTTERLVYPGSYPGERN